MVALWLLLVAPLSASPLTERDNALLEDVQKRAMLYFTEHSDQVTGLTRDRAPNRWANSSAPASISATGFALTAWCIADSRGWLPPGYALERVRVTLRFVASHVDHERGWLYHFIDPDTGRRVWHSEASTIDTALFLQGAIQAREYLNDPEVTDLVNRLYARVDWQWALNQGTTLSHGWRPERGFIRYRWDAYAEHMGLYLLGIGAPRHALPAGTWDAWHRPVVRYAGRTFIQAARCSRTSMRRRGSIFAACATATPTTGRTPSTPRSRSARGLARSPIASSTSRRMSGA